MPRCALDRHPVRAGAAAVALARTWPASWIAPPNSSSFSVSVVLPASGCEMMAKVRRRACGAAEAADASRVERSVMARMKTEGGRKSTEIRVQFFSR
jgi:hypothetical protein